MYAYTVSSFDVQPLQWVSQQHLSQQHLVYEYLSNIIAMSRVIFIFSLLGFCVALVVHGAAIVESNIAKSNWLYVLHGAVFVAFAPFVICISLGRTKENPFRGLTQYVPGKAIAIGVLLLIYIWINFIVFMAKSDGGVPDIWEGAYVLHNHGKLLKNISEAEYIGYKSNQLRGFSGHWLAFFYMPMVYFYFRAKKA